MGNERSVPANKAEFLDAYHRAWNELDTLISTRSNAEMTGLVDAVGWNVRDHLAHLIDWERGMIGLLRQDRQQLATGVSLEAWESGDYDRQNEELRQKTLNDDPQDVIDRLKETNATLLAMVDALPEAMLLTPVRDYCLDRASNPEEWSVLMVLHGDAGKHFAEHLPWISDILATQSGTTTP